VSIIGCIISLIPIIFNTAINFSCIGTLFYSTSLFVIAIKNSNVNIYQPIAYLGDKLSLNVYIFHVLIGGVISVIFKHILKINIEGALYLWTRPIITVILTIMFSGFLNYGKVKMLKKYN
jgi:hypothetical protein